MTTITITKSSDDNFKKVECSGHAGFADSGEDIVCAAVSVLTINLLNSIEKFTDDGIVIEQDEKKGLITLEFKDTPSSEADLLLRSFELGVTSISKQYGKKFLNIKFRRE
ncbi:ribosomal-processing cysteine protease Prp [Butyrivibrio sp. FCS014]|uniref:ribosomal-processing cysteine protease Prp n=1 Tax=Butyrivibrio sp. FCS014 TaxID=1408304 RepID=UPI0004633025|nr:ribosomal-processing cysteine protease Prp [Butyrivibrio sp. FCS014]